MKIVRFIRHYDLYNGGEVAGFEDAIADDLIARKIAVDPNAKPVQVPLVGGAVGDEITEQHVEFLKSRGYAVETVEAAKEFVANLKSEENGDELVAGFFAEAKEYFENKDAFVKSLDTYKTKADLVEFGKTEFGLDLSENSTRVELTDQLVAAHLRAEQQ